MLGRLWNQSSSRTEGMCGSSWEIMGLNIIKNLQRIGGPFFPSQDLMEYKGLLMDDLQCDFHSVGYWVQLVRKGPVGHMECLRILHHLLKDKGMASTYDDPEKSLALKKTASG